MNKYLKQYFLRGLMFGGFGPIVAGIVFLILQLTNLSINLTGTQIFMAIISTYLLAFIQAGSSVFNQIESWPTAKSLGIHFLSLYLAYSACYILNSWIPFDWGVIAIFSVIFIVLYLAIWLTVYLIIKSTSKKLNNAIIK